MTIRQRPQSGKQKRTEYLRAKWKSLDNTTNESLERTHQALLGLVSARWDGLTPMQREFFRAKQEWEDKWRERQANAQSE